MDVLTSKSSKDYNYTCRYSSFPYYYNKVDKKYVYGITSQLSTETEYVAHRLIDTDTLDSLALYYYGRPDLFWVIADFNRIQDSYTRLYASGMETIKIPSLAGIKYIR